MPETFKMVMDKMPKAAVKEDLTEEHKKAQEKYSGNPKSQGWILKTNGHGWGDERSQTLATGKEEM